MEISRSAWALHSARSQLLLHRQFGIRDIAGFGGPDQLTNPLFRRFANVTAPQGLYPSRDALGLRGRYLSLAGFATTTLSGHATDNLQVIAGVVIGGTSLFGGSGGLMGTLIGTIIPVVLLDGFVVLGLPPFWQQVAVGAVLIGAVYIDQLRRSLRSQAKENKRSS